MGPKGAGKTTLALTLARRGHGFFGDEIAGVRFPGLGLIPMRRSVSIRAGVGVDPLSQTARTADLRVERFPDGSPRWRGEVRRLFPEAGTPQATAQYIVFLGPVGHRTRVESTALVREHLSRLTPLACSLWGDASGRRAQQMFRLITKAQCVTLYPGTPDEAADSIERLTEG